jgi:predicted nucleic acid-binding protein
LIELDAGKRRGCEDADCFRELIDEGLVEVVAPGDIANQHFEELVIGPATETLDDGEAATIACAIEHKGIAILDERKANGICARKYPDLLTGCTVDLFAHPEVYRKLGEENLALSVLNALTEARMRVLPHYIDWVINLIGLEQAARCNSLPKAVRQFDGTAAK